jgi:hypothetical protein
MADAAFICTQDKDHCAPAGDLFRTFQNAQNYQQILFVFSLVDYKFESVFPNRTVSFVDKTSTRFSI